MPRPLAHSPTSDTVAAWTTGTGIGLGALMVTWLLGNRITALVWDPPAGPTAAFVTAIVVGMVTSVVAGRRLANS